MYVRSKSGKIKPHLKLPLHFFLFTKEELREFRLLEFYLLPLEKLSDLIRAKRLVIKLSKKNKTKSPSVLGVPIRVSERVKTCRVRFTPGLWCRWVPNEKKTVVGGRTDPDEKVRIVRELKLTPDCLTGMRGYFEREKSSPGPFVSDSEPVYLRIHFVKGEG